MLLRLAAGLLSSLLPVVLASPTPAPFDTPTKTMTTRAYKTSKDKGNTVKLGRKASIILGSLIGGFFAMCLLCIYLTVLKRSIQERRQEKMLQRKDKIEHERPDSEAQAEANKYPGLFETPQPQLDGQPANFAHDGAAPPYQNRDGPSTHNGFESAPNTTKPVVGNEGWKQGTVVAAPTSTAAVESKGQLDSDMGNSHDEKAPFKLF